MNSYTHRSVLIVVLIVCLSLAGCQGGGRVAVEKEMECTMTTTKFVEGINLMDPELGEMERGEFNLYEMECPDAYLDGTIYAILDTELHQDGTYAISGWHEMITKENGVWIGTCKTEITANEAKSTCAYTGDGKYKGLTNDVTLDFQDEVLKASIRVTGTVKK